MLRPCLVAAAGILAASGCVGWAGDGGPTTGKGGSGTAGAGGPGTAGNGTAGNGNPGTAGDGGPGTAGDGGPGTGGSGTAGTGGPTVTPPKQVLTTPMPCTSNAPGPRKLWRL